MNLTMHDPLIQNWYQWGHFVGLALSAGATFWVFYSAARRGIEPTLWKALTVAAVLLIFPSLALWSVPTVSTSRLFGTITPVAYLGVGGTILALISLVSYVAGIGVAPQIASCLNCGRPQDPSWDYCPHCGERKSRRAAAVPAQPALASAWPQLTELAMSRGPQAPQPRMGRTEVLRPASANCLAWIVLPSWTHEAKEFRLGRTTTVGRDPDYCDVVLDDDAVSRRHARVRLEDGAFILYDLGATNPTEVNGQEIGRHELVDGDRIKIGETALVFKQIEQPVE